MRQNHRAPLLSLLGLARRAGKLSLGNDAAVESLRKGQARLVLLASDLSPPIPPGDRSRRTAGGSALPGNRGPRWRKLPGQSENIPGFSR